MTLPAAASTALRPVLTGPALTGRVVGVFPSAVYVAADGQAVALVTADALRLPCSLAVAATAAQRPFRGVTPGSTAVVGGGRVQVGGVEVYAARWWQPARPRPIRPDDGVAQRVEAVLALLPPLPAPAGPALASLTRALLEGRREDAGRAAVALVGLGPGLTPDGDDALAALLLTLSFSPAAGLGRALAAAVTDRLARSTTTLSATLIRHAADGDGLREVVDLVDAVTGQADPERAVVRLLTVGHSSGTALAHGVLAAARVALAHDTVRSEVA